MNSVKMLKLFGIYTALLTPFDSNGEIDFESIEILITHQVMANVHGIVLFGSTGEAATISFIEREAVITRVQEILIKLQAHHIQLIVGTGHNSTKEAIILTKQAKELGINAALIVLPFYNRPSQEGIYQHFAKIHEEVEIPIIIYNVPSRTACSINNDTIVRLSLKNRIIGLKDSSGNLVNPLIISSLLAKEIEKNNLMQSKDYMNFAQLSGEDCTALAFNIHGGVGCISVASNIIPKQCKEIQELSLIHCFYKEAFKIQSKFISLYEILYCETNPVPLKYAAYKIGLIKTPIVRLPLWELSQNNSKKIDEELQKVGLI